MPTAALMRGATAALRPWMTYPAWTAMGLILLATALLSPQMVARIAPYPFLFSLVFLGLPHGAWDHRVVAAAGGRHLSLRHLMAVCTIYLVLVALYGVLWLAAPTPAFVLFIVISWLHWGQGDAAYLHLWSPVPAGPPSWLTWLVRGGAPILLPVFRFPEEFARIASGVTGLFGPARAADWLPPPWVRGGGLLLLALLAAAYGILLFRAFRRGSGSDRTAAREDAAEVALLYLVFSVANPVLAVGIYFCVWHGLRHIGRLLLLDTRNRALCAEGRVAAAGTRFGGQCLPILLASLGLLAGAYGWAVRDSSGTPDGLFVYLALISCLTFPHFLLVCWLDFRQNRRKQDKMSPRSHR
ncbi:MAG: Brp/Blh family beta-carotene 15,15'-dioxygenase [Cytophagales bacterium]|nr:Brp/Blh family beta-carotene 15,15'-dioxygenase [Armatimonadota bacterium]